MSDAGYDTDFFAWTQETAAKIRERRFEEIDWSALAEEIEDLGERDKREVNSRLREIIMHLLKLQFQPEKKTDSWTHSIVREQIELKNILANSKSLVEKAREDLPRTYGEAVRLAAVETGLAQRLFPSECPYTYEQILSGN